MVNYGVHPSESLIKRSGSSRGILLNAPLTLLRNRGFHVDYLGHAHRWRRGGSYRFRLCNLFQSSKASTVAGAKEDAYRVVLAVLKFQSSKASTVAAPGLSSATADAGACFKAQRRARSLAPRSPCTVVSTGGALQSSKASTVAGAGENESSMYHVLPVSKLKGEHGRWRRADEAADAESGALFQSSKASTVAGASRRSGHSGSCVACFKAQRRARSLAHGGRLFVKDLDSTFQSSKASTVAGATGEHEYPDEPEDLFQSSKASTVAGADPGCDRLRGRFRFQSSKASTVAWRQRRLWVSGHLVPCFKAQRRARSLAP